MMLTHRPPSPVDALTLEEVLDLKAAKPLAECLLAHRGHDLDLDVSQVRRLGGLCLQVLLAARAAWAEDGKCLTYLNASPAFIEGLERLGVTKAAQSFGVRPCPSPF